MVWVAAVGLLLVACSFIPFFVDLEVHGQGQLLVHATPAWGPLRLSRRTKRRDAAQRAAQRRERKRKKTRTSTKPNRAARATQRRRLKALLLSRDFVPSLGRLLGRYLRSTRSRNLRLDLVFGLGNPADTGRLCGILAPIVALLASLESVTVRIEPDFVEQRLELDAAGRLQVIPGLLILLTLGYLLTPAPWRALSNVARA